MKKLILVLLIITSIGICSENTVVTCNYEDILAINKYYEDMESLNNSLLLLAETMRKFNRKLGGLNGSLEKLDGTMGSLNSTISRIDKLIVPTENNQQKTYHFYTPMMPYRDTSY